MPLFSITKSDMTSSKLKNIGASVLWGVALLVIIAQAYRAIAYYIFDNPIDWTMNDVYVFGIAFMTMFVPNKLKSIIVDTATRVSNKK